MGNSVLDKAIAFAVKAHGGQVLDGENGLPYVTHPVEVLKNLRYVGGVTDEIMLTAAVLHDVIESSNVERAKLAMKFGEEVTTLVLELTRTEPTADDVAGKEPAEIWQLRSNLLLIDIERMSDKAKAIKLADRLANVKEARRTKSSEKLDRYLDQTEAILRIIPRDVNEDLWKAIRRQVKKAR